MKKGDLELMALGQRQKAVRGQKPHKQIAHSKPLSLRRSRAIPPRQRFLRSQAVGTEPWKTDWKNRRMINLFPKGL